MTVLIAGGGIAGLSLALTCHQIGVPCKVIEAAREVKPLGVGINLQPNAVRELMELGLGPQLGQIGICTKAFALYSKMGRLIWEEPRGEAAGYNWPQYSLHRGKLQMLLFETALERLGERAILTGANVVGYANEPCRVTAKIEHRDGQIEELSGSVLIGADGVHSNVRAQMYPDEGDALWSGNILWRATTRAKPFGNGATMAMAGHATHKFVTYPISEIDPVTGLADINWIAELSRDKAEGFRREDYSREAALEEFLPEFEGWQFDWLNVPKIIRGAERVYEYPMVDRDPLPTWRDGRVSLMGDAAHVMYPTGSNGASQAIIDARKLGRVFKDRGLNEKVIYAYEDEMRPLTERTILANRGQGPGYIMEIVEQKCGGNFEKIEDVLSQEEMAAFASKYKATAGFPVDNLNASPPIIPICT